MIRRLVLFDIDGTLLRSAQAGGRALRAAFQHEYADLSFFDAVRLDGKTDPQIVAELHSAAGFPERHTDETLTRVLDRYLVELDREISERGHLVEACPGVPALLDALEQRTDVVVGLLTGNIVSGAKAKLRAAGIDFDRFVIGAFGSDSAHRPDLPPIAAERAAARFGRVPSGDEVVIIGDTPADVTCGAAIAARAVAVATGRFSQVELQEAGAYATFETLADTHAVLRAIVA